MYVDIPGHKGNRLNAAYSYGGAELLMETIEQNFDIHISRYVLVNFEAFANLVDAVGGVDLELTSKEVEYVNGYLVEYNILLGRPEGTDYFEDTSGGMGNLNGPQALAYCRNRYIGTDFGRTERQRKVLAEVIHKLPQGMLTNPQELIDGLMPNLTTNLTQTECYRLSLMAPKARTAFRWRAPIRMRPSVRWQCWKWISKPTRNSCRRICTETETLLPHRRLLRNDIIIDV